MPDEENDNQDDEATQLSRDDLRALREKARAADQAQAQLAELQKKMLFSEAGLNPTDKAAQYFMKGYEGEMTAEAIKQEAEEVGLFRKNEQPRPQVPPQELAIHQQMNRATSGGGDPSTEDYQALIAAAQSAEEVMQIASRFGVPTTYNRPE